MIATECAVHHSMMLIISFVLFDPKKANSVVYNQDPKRSCP